MKQKAATSEASKQEADGRRNVEKDMKSANVAEAARSNASKRQRAKRVGKRPPKSLLEHWREVPGWSGYWVSDLGRVWSEKSSRELKQELVNGGGWSSQGRRKQGYRRVMLQRPGKRQKIYVHVLVCMAFVPGFKPSRGRIYQIDHINSDPADNSLANLQVLTLEDNQRKRSEYCIPASSRTPINPIEDFEPFTFDLGDVA